LTQQAAENDILLNTLESILGFAVVAASGRQPPFAAAKPGDSTDDYALRM